MHERESTAAFQAIHQALAAETRTREPMNALVVWTELGKGLAGMLEQAGGEKRLLRETIDRYCDEKSAAPGADLSLWAYQVPAAERLTREETASALQRLNRALEQALPKLAAAAEAGDEGRRSAFLAVVRGWFPVGLDLVRSLPRSATSSEQQRLAALRAWCDLYLPHDEAGPAGLGVKVSRGG